jgi:hypothetical protein
MYLLMRNHAVLSAAVIESETLSYAAISTLNNSTAASQNAAGCASV